MWPGLFREPMIYSDDGFSVNTNHIDPEYIKWLRIRDTLLRYNYTERDLQLAYQMACNCTWPDAKRLVSICDKNGGMPVNYKDARLMLLREGKHDLWAITLAGTMCFEDYDTDDDDLDDEDNDLVTYAAKMGHPFAEACRCTDNIKRALHAASYDEPEGLYELGLKYEDSDRTKAIQCFERACKLGWVTAFEDYASKLNATDPKRFLWAGKALANYNLNHDEAGGIFLGGMEFIMDNDEFYDYHGPVIYQIGKSLIGHINHQEKSVFGNPFDWYVDACFSFSFYQLCNTFTRDAMNTWTIIAKQMNVVKDIRFVISRLIWKTRKEGLYIHICNRPKDRIKRS